MSIKERCSMCGEFTDDEKSDSIYRMVKDPWSWCQDWEEVFVICERCFVIVIMGRVCRKVGEGGKVPV